MNDDARQELISAYLDGELTADEQRRVEQLLVDSAEHRQLFQELRSLRASFQALPRYQLSEDLSPRILRKAEEQLLRDQSAGAAPGALAPPKDTTASKETPGPKDTTQPLPGEPYVVRAADEDRAWSFRPGWRAIFWPAVVAAAAVAMMVLGPKNRLGQQEERTVARAPERGSAAPKPEARDSFADADPQAELSAAPADQTERNSAADGQPPADAAPARQALAGARAAEADRDQVDDQPADSPADRRQERQLRKSASTPKAGTLAEQDVSGKSDNADATETPSGTSEQTPASVPKAVGPGFGGLAGQSSAVGKGQALAGGKEMAPAGGKGAAAQNAAAAAPAEQAVSAKVADASRPEPLADELALDVANAGAEDAYVIDVELTPEAVRQQAFDQLLVRNQLTELSAEAPVEAGETTGLAADEMPPQSKAGSVEAAAKPADANEKTADDAIRQKDGQEQPSLAAGARAGGQGGVPNRGLLGRAQVNRRAAQREGASQDGANDGADSEKHGDNGLAQNSLGESPEVFEVTVAATPEQFVATLHDLRRHPEQFANSSVSYAQAPAAAQAAVGQFRAEQREAAPAAVAGPFDALNGSPAQAGAAPIGAAQFGSGRGQAAAKKLAAPAASKNSEQRADQKQRGSLADKEQRDATEATTTTGDAEQADKPGSGGGQAAAEKAKRVAKSEQGLERAGEGQAGQVGGGAAPAPQARSRVQVPGRAPTVSSQASPTAPASPSASGGQAVGGLQLRSQQGTVQLNLSPARGSVRPASPVPTAAQPAPVSAPAAPPATDNFQNAQRAAPGQPPAAATQPAAAATQPEAGQQAASQQNGAQANQTVRMIFRVRVAESAAPVAEPAPAAPPASSEQ